MFIPVIVYFVAVKYVPMLGLVVAFKNYNFSDGIWGSAWVGWDNFRLALLNPQTEQMIRNTLIISVLTIVVGFPMPIALAVLLNEVRLRWLKRTVQTLVYMPHFFSWVIVGGLVVTLFSLETGIVNQTIERFGGTPFAFLYDHKSWLTIFLASGVWKEAGFSAIIYLAALTAIDPSLYEAANIDGANKWNQIRHITIPGIMPIVILMLILSMGRFMEVGFDQVFILKNSVVAPIAEVISTYIYRVGFQGGLYGMTAAIGLFESVIGFVMVLAANRLAARYGNGLW
jgi:putative aldouronate transport system permease protein